MSQHYPSLIYTKEWVSDIIHTLITEHKLEIPFWELKVGFGQDVFGNVINFRLFNFLYVFFPSGSIEGYLWFRTFASLYLTGISFVFFATYKEKDKNAMLVGSMIYVFCGYTLFFAARHTFFLEMMFYLPLIFVGVEQILRKKKSLLFIVIVFLSATSYFYFLYMITIPAILYALFRYFGIRQREEKGIADLIKTIGMFLWQYVLGILLAAFSLLPSMVRSIQSGRANAQQQINYLHWDFSFYLDGYKGILDMQEIGLYGFIALSGISLFSVIYLLFNKIKEKGLYLGQLIVYSVTFMLPFFALIFNGMAGKTQRWCYIFAFWIAMLVVEVFPYLIEKNRRSFWVSCSIICVYLYGYYRVCRHTASEMEVGWIWIIVYMLILLLVNYTCIFSQHKTMLTALLLVCLCVETTFKSYELFSPEKTNYISAYPDAGKLTEVGNDNPSDALDLIRDDETYRVDVVSDPLSKKYQQMNYGVRNDMNGVSSYYSFSDSNICNYSLDLGNSQQNISYLILDWNQRTALNALSSVKYLTTRDISNHRVPYGYILVDHAPKTFSDGHVEEIYLYKNEYALPLMYTYESCITEETYKGLETNEKEQAMLQAIVLEKNPDYANEDLEFDYSILLDDAMIREQLQNVAKVNRNIEVHEDRITIKEDHTRVYLSVESGCLGEVYLMMNNMHFDSVNYSGVPGWKAARVAHVEAVMNDKKDQCSVLDSTHQYYMGERDFLLNLGYTEADGNIAVFFSHAGDYFFEDMKLICQPMDTYAEKIADLKEDPVTNVSVTTNQITGNVQTDSKKLLCISVPYSKGWTAYVNGEEVELYRANGMYMAVEVEPGTNHIELDYETPGLKMGCIISVGTLAIFVVIRIDLKKRRKRQ